LPQIVQIHTDEKMCGAENLGDDLFITKIKRSGLGTLCNIIKIEISFVL
jgi:hypothetical protein